MDNGIEEKIWEAVEKAVDDNWTPREFQAAVRSAWLEKIKRNANSAREAVLRVFK